MNTQREITKLKRENEKLQKQIKLLAIGLDVTLCANGEHHPYGDGNHETWERELEQHEGNPNYGGSLVWTLLKTL
jgi:CDGSH-type Zn-finger protein